MPAVERAAGLDASQRFLVGDYSGGLFHHDVSESAIELCRDPELAAACFGSLLCFLECAGADGCVHRIELPDRVRDAEPAKPVMAQLALRAITAIPDGLEQADRHDVLRRLVAFVDYLERATTGRHGLLCTPSGRASGFDSEVTSAGLPEYAVEGPDTNTFMVLEYRALAELARRLEQHSIADDMLARAHRLVARIERVLWNERAQTYVALRSDPGDDRPIGYADSFGEHRPFATWISLLPLLAGIAAPARADALFAALLNPSRYWGPAGVRTVPRDDPFFQQASRVMVYDPRRGVSSPVSNWSGPVWVLANYYMFRALAQYGHVAPAHALATTTARVLSDDLASTGRLHECYDDGGRGLWPPRGTFVSWNVLAATMLREASPTRAGPAP